MQFRGRNEIKLNSETVTAILSDWLHQDRECGSGEQERVVEWKANYGDDGIDVTIDTVPYDFEKSPPPERVDITAAGDPIDEDDDRPL